MMLYLKHIPFVNAANYVLDESGTHSEVPYNSGATNQNQSGCNFRAIPAAMEPRKSSFLQTSFDAKGRRLIIFIYTFNIYGMSTSRACISDFLSLPSTPLASTSLRVSIMTCKPGSLAISIKSAMSLLVPITLPFTIFFQM